MSCKRAEVYFQANHEILLPESLLPQPKQGFEVPLSYWFMDDLKRFIADTLIGSNPRLASYLNLDFVRRIVNDNNNSTHDFSRRIWKLIVFEEWLKMIEPIAGRKKFN